MQKSKTNSLLKILALLAISVAFTFVIRIPGYDFEYFCWDEHDYIAHNIYNKLFLGHFEVPYSNKWPMGHFLIYYLTLFFDPFQIHSYRFATAIIDALTCFTLALVVYFRFNLSFITAIGFTLFSSLAVSICLKSSMGILAESMANLFLVSGFSFLLLVTGNNLKIFLTLLSFCIACWVKPTALFPGIGILVAYYITLIIEKKFNKKDILLLIIWSSFFAFLSLLTYSINIAGIEKYFYNSAILYNFSFSQFKTVSFLQRFDFLFSGFAFFQFLFPLLILYGASIFLRLQSNYWILHGFFLGATISLFVRMDGGQTTYWIYMLPPLLLGSFLCLIDLKRKVAFFTPSIALWLCVVTTLFYGWAQNIYGQSKGFYFGGKGGLKIEQAQVTSLNAVIQALESDHNFIPRKSRLYLWGMPWQLFYLSKTIPSSSILTNETFKYGIEFDVYRANILNSISMSDYIVIENGEIEKMSPALDRFKAFFNDEHFTIFKFTGN